MKKFGKVAEKMVRKMLEGEDLRFEAAKSYSRVFCADYDDEVDWDILEEYAEKTKKVLEKSKKMRVKGFCLLDNGNIVINMLPLPAPDVIVCREDAFLRYRVTLFLQTGRVLVSLVRVAYTDEGKAVAGADVTKKESKLIEQVRAIAGRKMKPQTIMLDAAVDSELNVYRNTKICAVPTETELAEAVEGLPAPILWGVLHAVIAGLMPVLPEVAKPFYFPALRLSENDAMRALEYESLRSSLAGFSFGRAPGTNCLQLAELTLQDADSLKTLQRVRGLPVLARVDRDAVQRDITEMMQRAHCCLIATGMSKHPLSTVPLLIGEALPASNVVFAMDWPSFEAAEPEHLNVVKNGVSRLLQNTYDLKVAFEEEFQRLSLDGCRYCDAYFLLAAKIFDRGLFAGKAYRGTLLRRAEEMLVTMGDQRAERLKRFERAAAILKDESQYIDTVAPSANAMGEELAFRYSTSAGRMGIAFELKSDFPLFIRRRLGLTEEDSLAFRSYLRELRLVEAVSRNIRGRTGESTSHVLIFPNALVKSTEIR